jgi:hypothetical protein
VELNAHSQIYKSTIAASPEASVFVSISVSIGLPNCKHHFAVCIAISFVSADGSRALSNDGNTLYLILATAGGSTYSVLAVDAGGATVVASGYTILVFVACDPTDSSRLYVGVEYSTIEVWHLASPCQLVAGWMFAACDSVLPRRYYLVCRAQAQDRVRRL